MCCIFMTFAEINHAQAVVTNTHSIETMTKQKHAYVCFNLGKQRKIKQFWEITDAKPLKSLLRVLPLYSWYTAVSNQSSLLTLEKLS